ncbi:GTP 3',8-cyclase MoaA [Pseudoalteromonas sp. MMG010]|uniref:GTP 3',8-cyclase MoaA n=1 Tax=Pseudoalteromonas sp. MMG010 TaxID=2822685 RepID=UPI001B39F745|nr:GTP 3',8-cyclase MoaA [Pseudoalteromonas sp. MMG010]MBQ4832275.1 GTP 3',8-cyclase MoaA [Pseudoalteromonas sp. MMG010]
MLNDKFGRQFNYLRLSITDVCNFSCTYCLPDGYQCDTPRDFLSKDEITTLVNAFAQLGTKKVRITGGEPCLRKDVTDIIKLCKNTPNIEKVAITTNGFNLINKIDEFAEAGLDALNVSIDSLNPSMFKLITGHDKLQQIIKGIERAQQLGIKDIKINAVLAKQFNKNQLSDFLHWIKTNKVTVRFIELMETGYTSEFFELNHLSGQTIKNELLAQGWLQVVRGKLNGPAEEYFHPEYQGRIGLIMPYSKDFCKTCNRLRVSALGKLHLCLFAEQGIDLRSLLTEQDIPGTAKAIEAAMSNKHISHELDKRLTGATTHLAMLGG